MNREYLAKGGTEDVLSLAKALRRTLHACPELSMHETKTMETLKAFLREHTRCELHEEDGWFYAVHREGEGLPTIVFRCDTDAISGADGAFHGCGHDGHAAAVAGTAVLLDGVTLGKNIVYLFQPGEETGEGAKLCRAVLAKEHADRIYGCHSIPGYPAGELLLRRDVFACASRGMIIRLEGVQCHAAYPETGHNPAFAAAELIGALPSLLCAPSYHGMVLATVVGVRIGGRSFGVSAGSGEVCLTVRAHYEDDLETLIAAVSACAGRDPAIRTEISFIDVFPDTVLDTPSAEAFEALLDGEGISHRELEEPLRWSEDFGWYCREAKGVFFGVGAGEDSPALHTPEFEYNDDILGRVMDVFSLIAKKA